ncbi:MAG: UDP-2,3-diacylglucosamine diphosphatase LpxI [Pseudomonadota bacterium]|nr:UDP-2,3-diacylglucosamine diphosphatase LpxI [Pseudomonadota bacterium]
MKPDKIGIIAGGGSLPEKIAKACEDDGKEVFIIALENQSTNRQLGDYPGESIKMGEVKYGIDILRREGISDLVFAGPVTRPSLRELNLDGWTMSKAIKLGLRWFGDDSILSALVKTLEDEGFNIHGPEELLENSLCKPGPFGKHLPTDTQWGDIKHGLKIARAIGELDIGQSAVVQQGIVLGVEGIDGTDALIERCGPLQRSGKGAILMKTCKPQQERRIDLPTIGLQTVSALVKNRFSGVVIEAAKTLVLDEEALTKLANDAGLFVYGIEQ